LRSENVTLSVILITKNEAANIRACLESVAWADEIVVVDSGSTDGTVEIAREFTGKVYVHSDWPGFGPQKNRSLDNATGDWILSLDADERIPPELRAEIEAVLAAPIAEGYFIPRLSQFCGYFVHHSGWRPDYVLRLFRRSKARFSESRVHESVICNGKTAKLKQSILHYSYLNRDDVERKVQHYSAAAAQQMFEAGKRAGLAKAVISGSWAFIRTYLLRLGVLDGAAGWNIAVMNARTTWLKYRRLAQLNAERN